MSMISPEGGPRWICRIREDDDVRCDVYGVYFNPSLHKYFRVPLELDVSSALGIFQASDELSQIKNVRYVEDSNIGHSIWGTWYMGYEADGRRWMAQDDYGQISKRLKDVDQGGAVRYYDLAGKSTGGCFEEGTEETKSPPISICGK
ncbi:hypothetical protein M413DRAFT_9808 [Hebeloma cylindrosporum]|uniref:Uncharacterized protein n=1 Tax=Hebeloma cylindrosporum TaxID=76867 RepID=A0A0C3C222_HEBCY|nr:hypothetical protein M413DRAFT_9808 [Hebeloma cylindrosporum h7]